MAVVPLSGTDVRLLSGVPFSSNYRETRYFSSKSTQEKYFTGKNVVHKMDKANFVKREDNHRYAVNAPIGKIMNANYMMFRNSDYGDKWFYAFIDKLEFENKHTTWVHFQIDVFQTWIFDVEIQDSFVKREHTELWNDDGTPKVHTEDEGLDYGDEYDTINAERFYPIGGYKWLVIVCTEKIHSDSDIDPTFIGGVPQPLTYYVAPFSWGGTSPVIDIPSADMDEPEPITEPEELLKNLYKDEDAVGKVVSVYITESLGGEATWSDRDDDDLVDIVRTPDNLDGKYVNITDGAGFCVWVKSFTEFEAEEKTIFKDKWEGFTKPNESKLMMSPYAITILDDMKGNRQVYQTENINDDSLTVVLKGSLGLSNKVSWSIKNYNRAGKADYDDYYLSNEHAVINENPTDVPVMNDMLAAFMQGNRNSLEAQKKNAYLSGGAQMAGGAISAVATGGLGAVYGGLQAVSGASQIANTIGEINAKKKDIDNQPAEITKMGSNTAYQYGHKYNGIWVIQKQVKAGKRHKLEQYFNMFGYQINDVKEPNLRTRKSWNYVETKGIIMHGDMNNEDLNDLKQVFDNGITLWHTDDVGNYKKNNEVR